jgi:hypothetical protein
MTTKNRLAAVAAALLIMAGNGFTADANDESWRFAVTVPLWAPSITGDATVRGTKADVDVDFSDLKDALDAALSLGIEVRKRNYGFYGDFGYMKFSADASGPRGSSGNADLKFIVANAGGFFRLADTGGDNPFILEMTAGLRYWYVGTHLELTGPLGREVDAGDIKRLYDPVIGLRGSQYLTPKLHLDVQGDVGGFGISSDSSDLTWSAGGLLSYDFATWFTLSAGYKALALDKSDGSGTSEHGVDLIFHGVLIAAKFTF